MLDIEYSYLVKIDDKIGHKWEIDGVVYTDYADASLFKILNIVSELGWELICKENNNTYILKRNK